MVQGNQLQSTDKKRLKGFTSESLQKEDRTLVEYLIVFINI